MKNIKRLGVIYFLKLHVSLLAQFFPTVEDEKSKSLTLSSVPTPNTLLLGYCFHNAKVFNIYIYSATSLPWDV